MRRPDTAAACERRTAAGRGGRALFPAARRGLSEKPQRRMPAAQRRGAAARPDADPVARDGRGLAALAGGDRRLARRAGGADRRRSARSVPRHQCQRGAVALPLGAGHRDDAAHHPACAERLSDDRLCRKRAGRRGVDDALSACRRRCARSRAVGIGAGQRCGAGCCHARQLEQRRADRHRGRRRGRARRRRALHCRLRAIGRRCSRHARPMGRRCGDRHQRQMAVRRTGRGVAMGRAARPHRARPDGARLVEPRQSVRDGYRKLPLCPRCAPLVGRHPRRRAIHPVGRGHRSHRRDRRRAGARA